MYLTKVQDEDIIGLMKLSERDLYDLQLLVWWRWNYGTPLRWRCACGGVWRRLVLVAVSVGFRLLLVPSPGLYGFRRSG